MNRTKCLVRCYSDTSTPDRQKRLDEEVWSSSPSKYHQTQCSESMLLWWGGGRTFLLSSVPRDFRLGFGSATVTWSETEAEFYYLLPSFSLFLWQVAQHTDLNTLYLLPLPPALLVPLPRVYLASLLNRYLHLKAPPKPASYPFSLSSSSGFPALDLPRQYLLLKPRNHLLVYVLIPMISFAWIWSTAAPSPFCPPLNPLRQPSKLSSSNRGRP